MSVDRTAEERHRRPDDPTQPGDLRFVQIAFDAAEIEAWTGEVWLKIRGQYHGSVSVLLEPNGKASAYWTGALYGAAVARKSD